jgi:response regulator RpfG family c-di-GMP phosphodiesterase
VSGLDVTKWLKSDEALKKIPVIAVTAFAMKGDEEKIRQGGCEDYISKPISVSRFLEVIQNYLNKPVEEENIPEEKQESLPEFSIRDSGEDEEEITALDDLSNLEDDDADLGK